MVENTTIKEKLSGLWWLMRPLNSTTAGIAVVVALHLAFGNNNPTIEPLSFIFIALAAFFVTAHSMVHNDIVDYEIDKINAPHRAIPSGVVSLTEAKVWAIILGISAVISGLLIDIIIDIFPFSIFWAILNILILDIYNYRLKQSGLLGNLVIGYVVAALFIYADIVVNSSLTIRTQSIGLYALFVIWGREVFKDIMDIKGDSEHGIRTIPVIFGPKVGAIIGSIIIGIGIVSTIPLIINPISGLTVPIVLVVLNTITIILCIRIIQNPEKELIYKSKLWLLRMLLIALVILAINQFVSIYV